MASASCVCVCVCVTYLCNKNLTELRDAGIAGRKEVRMKRQYSCTKFSKRDVFQVQEYKGLMQLLKKAVQCTMLLPCALCTCSGVPQLQKSSPATAACPFIIYQAVFYKSTLSVKEEHYHF